MPSCKVWDIVRVPFPYTDRPVRQRRPALVVSTQEQDSHGLLWVLMITSAENRRWDGDVSISDLKAAGLPVASVVRCVKIATIEARDAETIGMLPAPDRRPVGENLIRALSGATAAS